MPRGVTMWIGTSGWQYKHWRGCYYPPELAQVRWLEQYTQDFATVELNVSFYRQPRPEAFERWARVTPGDFVMTVKASRYLTHIRRLREPEESVERVLEPALRLGRKLGPVLVQLPPTLKRDTGNLARTLAAFPPRVRVAVEFRHESWFVDEVRDVLGERGAALVWADRDARWLTPSWRTAQWAFVRFHSGRAKPETCYASATLARRAADVVDVFGRDAEAFVYFNNDPNCCALRDARAFARGCDRLDVGRTRVPAARAVQMRAGG